jgi:ABC-2 type transport system permease protein
MRALIAFFKKEMTEQARSGKLLFLTILFVLLGIMNPAIAKLTPWLLETMADSLADSGMTVTAVTVSAMDSWVQFFKNVSMGLIAFVLMQSNIFTKEYQSGTLILTLTKGLRRSHVVLAKTAVLMVLWTAAYWLYFAITYLYNAYFWDNTVAQNLTFSVLCWWLFGLFTVALVTLFSVLCTGNTGVLLGTGGVVLACYLLGLLPDLSKYLPTRLADGNSLIFGLEEPSAYTASLTLTAILTVLCLVLSVPIFNRKHL